jgi:uncharacterized protein (TIGR02284 family)
MARRRERAVLNHLIETCRDAERGFQIAAGEVKAPELRRLFLRLAEQRHDFASELLPYAQRLGGASVGDGTRFATLHRAWLQLKAHLANNPERAVLEEAARGERFAVAAFDEAVHDLVLPDARELIQAQDLGVRVARRLVTGMAAN